MGTADSAGASEQKRRRFFDALESGEKRYAAELERAQEELKTDREGYFARFIERGFTEAWWIMRTGQFPDGRPMVEQSPVKLGMWAQLIDAIDAHTWGGATEGDPDVGTPD